MCTLVDALYFTTATGFCFFLLQCVTSLKVNNCLVCADKRNPFLRQALPVKSVEPGGKSNELVNKFKRFYF